MAALGISVVSAMSWTSGYVSAGSAAVGQRRSTVSTEAGTRSHAKALPFQPRNGYPMTLTLLTSSNGTVVLPPIWVS